MVEFYKSIVTAYTWRKERRRLIKEVLPQLFVDAGVIEAGEKYTQNDLDNFKERVAGFNPELLVSFIRERQRLISEQESNPDKERERKKAVRMFIETITAEVWLRQSQSK